MGQTSSYVKEEGRLDDIAHASSTLLPDVAKKAMSAVPIQMKSIFMVYDLDFRDFLGTHEDVAGEP